MLKLLIKKQLTEQYAGLFYDQKKNKARSRAGTLAMIALTVLLGLGVFGVLLTMLSLAICEPLVYAGMGWLYFTILGLIALFLGLLGGSFAAYTHLYKSKDNDTLLSLPIPERDILASRIVSVYINVGGMCLLALLPALVVYWVKTGPGVGKIAGGLLFAISVSLLALVLSCLLGYLVAKISTKMKNKSVVTVLASLLIMGVYYFFYFRFQGFIRNLVTDPESFRKLESIPGLKFFGQAGEAKILPLLVLAVIAFGLTGLTLYMLVRGFGKIVSAAGSVARVKYKEKEAKQKAPFKALLGREITHLAASPGYMLNGALGSVILVLFGGAILIKGSEIAGTLRQAVPMDILTVITAGVIAFLAGTNILTPPSVSLEGKYLWILKSLPVASESILKAKLGLHLLVTCPAVLFISLSLVLVLKPNALGTLLILLFPQLCVLLYASFGLMVGLIRPHLNWTNEMVPIKSSLPAVLSMFGSWFYSGALVGLYFWIGRSMGGYAFLGLAAAITLLLTVLILIWLKTRGVKRFDAL